MESTHPNIILIMVESWDGRIMGCLGNPALKDVTPNIDALARNGANFSNNYTSHPICCPARANMWSGQYTFRCKSWNNHKGLEPGTPILPDLLVSRGGYRLAARRKPRIGIGKHDYLSGGHSQQNRVTAWTGCANIQLPSYMQKEPMVKRNGGEKYHEKDWHRAKKAIKFLKKQARRQEKGKTDPFFLYLSLTTPHPRFRTSDHWLSKVNVDAIQIPPRDEEVHPVFQYQRISKDWRHGFSPQAVRNTRAIYYAMVAETDAVMGTVIDAVVGLGLEENTIIIITADHGENNMEHRLFYKMNMYESASRVPLVIAGPGVKRGQVCNQFTSTVDLYPTILDMAGIPVQEVPRVLDGLSIVPIINGNHDQWRDHAFSMYTGTAANTSMFMIRSGKWKYIAYPGFKPQLFNLESDPWEIHDLTSSSGDITKELDEKLRCIVDYDQVHREWQAYCRKGFIEWREAVREKPVRLFEYGARILKADYEHVMKNTYKGWAPEHSTQLERWLQGAGPASNDEEP
ncbi:sulfatase-like hydrolase/transferase [Candidatus Bathyarchaeota archaeon]|nr:sulfatase-like hydrolase/transferase [Candidatus Bathyarchaeota archaeon]